MTLLTDDTLDDMFEEYLTEVYGEFKVGNDSFDAGHIVRELDPVIFRCELANWLDNEVTEGNIFEYADGTYHDCEEESEDE